MPVNWRALGFEQAAKASELAEDEGVPLVWVPGAELTAEVCEQSSREDALAFLVREDDRVLADIEITLGEIADSELAGWAGQLREAIASYRDGHTAPAQALAAAVLTAGLERGLEFEQLKKVRKLAG